jgi:hypothetical protein
MSAICMKLDPGMHIGLHLVFFGKTGVTLKQRDAPPTPPQDLATAVHVCTAHRCLVQNITDRTRGAHRALRYVIHSATHLIYS